MKSISVDNEQEEYAEVLMFVTGEGTDAEST